MNNVNITKEHRRVCAQAYAKARKEYRELKLTPYVSQIKLGEVRTQVSITCTAYDAACRS